MASRFCAACGAPVLDATDTFCGNCGSPLTRSAPPSMPLARPAPLSMPLARPVPQSMPLAAPPAMPGDPAFAAAAPTPMPTPIVSPSYPGLGTPPARSSGATPNGGATDGLVGQKLAALALLLEVLVPGAGALYAGRAWRGIAWLVGTLVGLVLEVILLDSMHPLRSSIIGVSYLAWIVVRCVLVSDLVEARNTQVRGEPPPPLYSAGGATGATICAVVVALLLGSLVLYAQRSGSSAVPALAFWGWAVVAAYWVALCRLPRAGALRVCAEVLGWNLLIFLVVDIALLVVVRGALAARGISPLRERDLPIMQDLAGGRVAVEVVVAGLLGYAFALTFARWSGVRALRIERIERGTVGAVALALLVTGVVALGYFVVLLALAGRFDAPRLANLAALWAIGVPLVVWAALPAYAGWRALRVLRASAPAQPAAPPLAPTPPQPAYWPR